MAEASEAQVAEPAQPVGQQQVVPPTTLTDKQGHCSGPLGVLGWAALQILWLAK